MASPTAIAAYLALFAVVGLLFVFVNLLIGRLVRPSMPNEQKLEIYECGEPAIGSGFMQFDLRFYVVALLFIIFDVEVAFFFPWATVFGKATELRDVLDEENKPQVVSEVSEAGSAAQLAPVVADRLWELGVARPGGPGTAGAVTDQALSETADRIVWTSFADIGVFFGVLLVGFAYVWKRGDLDWVRAMSERHRPPAGTEPATGSNLGGGGA